MTPRERKLLYGIACLLPLTLICIAGFTFRKSYMANKESIVTANQNIKIEKAKQRKVMNIKNRRRYYDSISLPPNIQASSNEYASWLKFLLTELQIDYKSVTPRDKGGISFKRKPVGSSRTFSVNATGNLAQLTEFLNRFYSVDLLHRINTLKINPKNTIVGGKDDKIRSGKLSLSMEIEVLAITTADENREFTKQFRDLARAKEDYQRLILRRDIFGEKNNKPVVDATPRKSYLTDKEVSVNISASDADEENQLTFELIESEIKEAELIVSEGERRGKIVMPGQKPGRFKFKVRVVDDGLPVKESFKEFTVVVQDPAPPKVVKKPTPKPDFVHATQAKVTAIVKDKNADFRVWITVRTTGEKYQLKTGDSFKLDKKDWLVDSISQKEKKAVLRVGGKLLTFGLDSTLSEPMDETQLAAEPTAPVEKVESETSQSSPSADVQGVAVR
ncbi:MAG: hypothetical protein AB8B55_18380 [Mariniblastus sp.]